MSEKKLFIISPIKSRGSEEHEFYDKVRRHIITPAAKNKGYVALRADQIRRPGRITAQIITRLIEDDLVIADISTGNPNVFYELAIRHAVKKPVILISSTLTDHIPFDVRDQRIIEYSLDPDVIQRAITEIEEQIVSVEDHSFVMDSPVTDVINIDFSDNPSTQEELLGKLIEEFESLSSQLSRAERDKEISSPVIQPSSGSDLDTVIIQIMNRGFSIRKRTPSQLNVPNGADFQVSRNYSDFMGKAERGLRRGSYINIDYDSKVCWYILTRNGEKEYHYWAFRVL